MKFPTTLTIAALTSLTSAVAIAAPAPFGAVTPPGMANPEIQPVRYVHHRRHHARRHVIRRRYVVAPGYARYPRYVAAPRFYPGAVYGNHGDPLHRYYTPGLAPSVGNPSVSPSYQNPAVDDGTLFPKNGD